MAERIHLMSITITPADGTWPVTARPCGIQLARVEDAIGILGVRSPGATRVGMDVAKPSRLPIEQSMQSAR